MSNKVDLRNLVADEYCQDVKEVATKVGVTVVCDDEEEQKAVDSFASIHVKDYPGCDDMQETVSKYGVQVVCDED